MSLCINPRCPRPNHPDNSLSRYCAGCGSDLLLKGRLSVMRLLSSQSGFGQVYEAFEQGVPKILKVLKESHSQNSKVLELFKREAEVLSQLNHPGVPRVRADGYFAYYPKGAAEPLHCIEMEKIDGPNLKQWMVQQGNHPISNQQAVLWLTQLVDVLHLVHQQNYFHRDIKPENIMLRSLGQLVLVDFGAAREMTDTYVAHLGASGITTISSAGYTPPEQEQGLAVPQSDFYALGRTIIYLLTAKAPTDPTIYDSRANEFNWRQFAPQVSPPLADLIDDMIAPRALDRPQTTQEILDRLVDIQRSVTVAPAASVAPQKPWPATTLGNSERGTLLQKGASRPSLWLVGGIGVALLALVGIGSGVWYFYSGLRLELGALWRNEAVQPTQKVSQLKTLPGHSGSIQALALLADGETLISGSADTTLRVWDIITEAQVKVLEGHMGFVNALAVTPTQTRLLSGGADENIIFWDTESGEPIRTLETAHESTINAIAISPDSRVFASADAAGIIKLWNLETAELIRVLSGHTTSVNDLVFSHDSQTLVSAGQSLRKWDLETGESEVLYTTEGSFINGVAISSDNQRLISVGADKMIRLWDLSTGESIESIQGHDSYINDVIISRDGQTFLTAGADKTVRVWDMNDWALKVVLTGFDSDIYRFLVRFSQGQIITVGGEDNTIKVWLLSEGFD